MHQIIKKPGAHYIEDAQGTVAEMTYSNAGGKAMIIDHTYVRDSHRGQGLGKALLDSLVAEARERGMKIIPLCPFVKAQFDKNRELYRELSVV